MDTAGPGSGAEHERTRFAGRETASMCADALRADPAPAGHNPGYRRIAWVTPGTVLRWHRRLVTPRKYVRVAAH